MPTALSDAKVRNAKPRTKPYKISDAEGLFLLVTPSGSKYWRLKYFFADKERLLCIGRVSGSHFGRCSRRGAPSARKLLAAGI